MNRFLRTSFLSRHARGKRNKAIVLKEYLSSLANVGVKVGDDEDVNIYKPPLRRSDGALANREYGKRLREEEFLLDKNITNCNGGSFGCVPRRVFEQQRRFFEEREQDPDGWFRQKRIPLYFKAAREVAEFLGADHKNLNLLENASTGINVVLKSFPFQPGDQIICTSHTYNPARLTIRRLVGSGRGIENVVVPIPFPILSDQDIISRYVAALDENPRIKFAIVDGITCSTGVMMPVAKLIQACHSRGVKVMVDGAHMAGHVQLEVEKLGADFFIGSFHKWMFTPRGCGFLWVHPDHHDMVMPLVHSHQEFHEDLIQRFRPEPTRDSTPMLSAPAAIQFHKDLGGLEGFQQRNSNLAKWAAEMTAEAWKTRRLPLAEELRAPFLALTELPPQFKKRFPFTHEGNLEILRLMWERGVNVSIYAIQETFYCRLSCQVHNCEEDYYRLRDAVLELAKEI